MNVACCFLANSDGLFLWFAAYRIATQSLRREVIASWSRDEPMGGRSWRGVLLKHAPGFQA